ITVNVAHDVTAEDDETTLREAIALANADPASPDTINFDSGLSYDRIKVKGELVIAGNTIIDASDIGAVRVSRFNYNDYLDSPGYQDFLDGNSEQPEPPIHHRIFYVSPDADVELSGLIVEGGSLQQDGSIDLNAMQDEPFGAGIFNTGRLVIRDSAVAGNQIWGDVNNGQAIGGGAGIYNAAGANLELESTEVGELRFQTAELEAIGIDPERFDAVLNPVTNVPDPTQRVYIKRNISQGIAAGILNEGTMVVRNSSVFSNAAYYGGGGVYNAGEASVVNSRIESNTNNEWQTGGGILNSDVVRSARSATIASITRPSQFSDAPSLTIVDSVLRDHFGWRGGAIYNENAELSISGATLEDNLVQGASAEYSDQPFAGGAAIFIDGGDVSIKRSTFTANMAPSPGSAGPIPAGGAIFSWGNGATEIQNTTFSGNETQRGAAIYNHNRPLSLVHTTITENHATENGGALFLTTATGVEIGGSIIAGNTAGTGSHPNIWTNGLAASLGHNLIGTIASGRLDADSTDILNEETTGLGPLGDFGGTTETYGLLPSSPAYNAVPAGTFDSLETDQRGEVRLHGPASDIGAFESQPPATLRVDTLSDVVDGFYGPGELSLREALLWAEELPGPDSVGFADSLVSEVLDSDDGFGTITLSSTLVLDHDVSIIGPGADVISLSGDSSHRVVQVPANTDVTLQGITIRDGLVSEANGGGIENLGNLRLIDSVVTENEASGSQHGGGVMNQTGSTFFMDGSTVHNNTAGNAGGGVYFRGDVTIVNSTVSNNRANQGGGFYGHKGTASITNSTLTENLATLRGGAIRNWETFVTVTNSIMADNSAPTAPELFVSYSDRQISGGNNFIGVGAVGFTDGVNGDIVGTEASPLSAELGRLSDAGASLPVHRPLPASPVIDAGKSTSLLVDQFDQKRGSEGSPDIGAVEFVTQSVPDGPLVVNVDEGRSDGYYGLNELGLDDALAIAALRPGADEITFDDSLSGAVIHSARELVIGSDVTIVGLGADQLTIQPSTRGFRVEPGVDAEIRGLTIANGYHGSANSGAGGAGILNEGTLSVKDMHIKGNWNIAHIDSDDPTVPADGGGIYNSGDLTIVRTTISDSIANRGAGIFNTGDLVAVNVTLSDNLVSGNSTENGGNVFNSGTARFSNSTITDGRSNLASATAGVYTDAGGQTTFKNTIVADNTDLSSSGVDDITTHANGSVVSLGYNLIGEAPGFPAVSTDQLNAEPMLVPLQISNSSMPIHELLPGSPAIDNGGTGATKDQRFRTKNKGAGPDIGAVETRLPAVGTVLVVSRLSDEVNGDYNNGDLTFREAILLSNTLSGPDTIRFSQTLVEDSVRASGSATIEVSAAWFGDATLEITDDVTIEVPSGSEGSLLALIGDGTDTLLRVSNSASVEVQNMRFTGAGGNDGAIHIEDGSLVLTDSIVEANSTHGIVNSTNGVLELTGSVIRNNTSTDNGAGIRSSGDTRINRTVITGNRFDGAQQFTYGGGIYADAGTLTVERSEVSHNTASIQGGGVYLANDVAANVSYTTISNNSVHLGDSVGGGVFTYSTADVNFVNVTIAENSAVKEAG
ncbi:MAG: choice-of-anchor Q domain-containing protein, partial [Planctomycetaceae bacterium]